MTDFHFYWFAWSLAITVLHFERMFWILRDISPALAGTLYLVKPPSGTWLWIKFLLVCRLRPTRKLWSVSCIERSSASNWKRTPPTRRRRWTVPSSAAWRRKCCVWTRSVMRRRVSFILSGVRRPKRPGRYSGWFKTSGDSTPGQSHSGMITLSKRELQTLKCWAAGKTKFLREGSALGIPFLTC